MFIRIRFFRCTFDSYNYYCLSTDLLLHFCFNPHLEKLMRHEPVTTKYAPAAIGPYSQGVLVGDTLYTSGQIPIEHATGVLYEGTIAEETEIVLNNLEAVLKNVNMDFSNVVSSRVYMTDLKDFGAMNEVYGKCFGDTPPARETVQVSALPRGARVEIAMIAVK